MVCQADRLRLCGASRDSTGRRSHRCLLEKKDQIEDPSCALAVGQLATLHQKGKPPHHGGRHPGKKPHHGGHHGSSKTWQQMLHKGIIPAEALFSACHLDQKSFCPAMHPPFFPAKLFNSPCFKKKVKEMSLPCQALYQSFHYYAPQDGHTAGQPPFSDEELAALIPDLKDDTRDAPPHHMTHRGHHRRGRGVCAFIIGAVVLSVVASIVFALALLIRWRRRRALAKAKPQVVKGTPVVVFTPEGKLPAPLPPLDGPPKEDPEVFLDV
eukprot:181173_1